MKNTAIAVALISAAPEMYEALADIAENCGNRGCSETCAEAGCKIYEILKKARGESCNIEVKGGGNEQYS